MTTTTETTTTRTCPPSAVADQIVRWFQVQEGEAVLFGGHLRLLVAMWPAMVPGAPDLVGVRLLDGGETQDFKVGSNDLTAVRRYTEGISERDALVIAALDRAADDCEQQALAWDCRACVGSEHGPGKCPEHLEYLTQAAAFRAERDRLEAGRG